MKSTLAILALLSAGCGPVSERDELEAPDDDATGAAAADDDEPAVLEDASALDDGDEPLDLVDDAPDLAESDEELPEPGDEDDGVDVAYAMAAAGQYVNPLGPNCADPGIVKISGDGGPTFWVSCTGGNYPLFKSRDLVHWTAAGHIFNAATKPHWASGNNWAPEIHKIGNKLVAYFTAFSPSRGRMCIGAARASTMAGPWTDLGRPLVCDKRLGLIDASVHTDPGTGKRYLYYKTDGNAQSPQEQTIIYGHQLTANGLGFVGTRKALLRNTLHWEGDVVEAPWVIHRGAYFYMFYSGFRYCNGTYGVGVARSRSPLGPFTKRSGPILHSNGTWAGPGHNAFVRAGGHPYLVYHAWEAPHSCGDTGTRKLMLDRVRWEGGWPVINNGTPSVGPRAAPLQ